MGRIGGLSFAFALVAWFLIQAISGVSASNPSLSVRQHAITAGPTATVVAAAAAAESFTAVSECHLHGADAYCMFGTEEYSVSIPVTATATGELPATFTECHHHGQDSYCVAPDGSDVEILGMPPAADGSSGEATPSSTGESGAHSEGQHCHFHAGVEHCVGGSAGSEKSSPAKCTKQERDYNIGLRIGLLFVMFVTGLIGAAGPILLATVLPPKFNIVFSIVKQFGTGVIISTAFVHLFTHATLMLTNECLGESKYEATTAAILMAGLFISFLIDYFTHRAAKGWSMKGGYNDEVVGVMILEAGIIFHSVLIGITVVVAGDSYFVTLFVVIVFHQMFEGIALGSRIAAIGAHKRNIEVSRGPIGSTHTTSSHLKGDDSVTGGSSSGVTPIATSDGALSESEPTPTATPAATPASKSLSKVKKIIMALAFAITTPIGMAIGIGVLHSFNGNDPTTLKAIGTLDALSAGILVWVGVVEMWAGDWMFGGELANASPLITALALVGFIAGMALMSFLGKWA
ncbi:high-affinity Zn(2+) transporter zrt1 [Diatrype stigma]|uniref:High-affinity Zn(2+) transporter zrt1 n=1 Tax=Diatrype stigma TaxID=117547 RepID=A0AAN9YS85_9PEZI